MGVIENGRTSQKKKRGEIKSFGGPFPKHAAALRLRLDAKDVMDNTVHTGLPARKEVRVAPPEHWTNPDN
jgi:hypothetical protein